MTAVSIIGAGRLGASLAYALVQAGYEIRFLCSRTLSSARESAKIIGRGRATTDILKAARESEILFLSVPDDSIGKIAGTLARSRLRWAERTVFHCSGRLSSSVLDPLKQKGASTGSFHPAQSLARKRASLELFKGIYYGIEGDGRAMEAAQEIVRKLGGHAVLLSSKEKPLYHAACVLCSGGVTALLKTAASFLEKMGLEEKTASEILWPLAQRTLQNVKEIGARASLTGPLVREDLGTVIAHLKAIPGPDPARNLYKAVGLISLEMAAKKKPASTKFKALKKILEGR